MKDRAKPDQDDWEQFRTLEQRIGEDGAPDPAEWRDLLLRVGLKVGIASEECETALATARGAADLVRRVRRCFDEANERFDEALFRSRDLEAQRRRKEARRVLERFIEQETVLLFREVAEYQLGTLEGMRVIAEHEYGFVDAGAEHAGKVILRIGVPEQEAPSDWVLPFEIVGPAEERIESGVHGVDAVQALHHGLRQITAELRSLQERAGGTLTFFEKEGVGFDPLPP